MISAVKCMETWWHGATQIAMILFRGCLIVVAVIVADAIVSAASG